MFSNFLNKSSYYLLGDRLKDKDKKPLIKDKDLERSLKEEIAKEIYKK